MGYLQIVGGEYLTLTNNVLYKKIEKLIIYRILKKKVL